MYIKWLEVCATMKELWKPKRITVGKTIKGPIHTRSLIQPILIQPPPVCVQTGAFRLDNFLWRRPSGQVRWLHVSECSLSEHAFTHMSAAMTHYLATLPPTACTCLVVWPALARTDQRGAALSMRLCCGRVEERRNMKRLSQLLCQGELWAIKSLLCPLLRAWPS